MIKIDKNVFWWSSNNRFGNLMHIRTDESFLNAKCQNVGYITTMDIYEQLGIPFDINAKLDTPLGELTYLYEGNEQTIEF